MSQEPFTGHFIINGRACLLYINETNELVWVPCNDKFNDDGQKKNHQIHKRSAKYKLVKQKRINFDSILSIKLCYCDGCLIKNKRAVQCGICSNKKTNGKLSEHLITKTTSTYNDNQEYTSAISTSLSSSKSPSPISGESLTSDGSLGFVDVESSNESGNFSAQSALSLVKITRQQAKEGKDVTTVTNPPGCEFKGKQNKSEKEDHMRKCRQHNNHFLKHESVKVIKIYYVIEKRGTRGRLLRLSSMLIEPSNGHHDSISSKLEPTDQTPLDELSVKLGSSTRETTERRPKSLLVFINPYGGKGRALEIYKTKVKYVFDVANVDVNVIVTEYANHARDMIENPTTDLKKYDGIICVGGDGMFGELVNGMLFRTNKKLMEATDGTKYNHNDDKENCEVLKLKSGLGGIGRKLEAPTLPIGVIGAGSTNANSFGVLGTNDSITAALNMVLGRRINIDICSIHSLHEDSKILRFVSTFVSYGYFGDIIKNSEALRWMGPKRYDICAAQNILKHRSYAGEIRILLSPKDGSPSDDYRCGKNCLLCSHAVSQESSSSIADDSRANANLKIVLSDGEKTYTSGEDSGRTEYDYKVNNNNNNNCDDNQEDIHYKTDNAAMCNRNNNNDIMASNNNNPITEDGSPLKKGPHQQEDGEYVIVRKEGSFIGINTAVMACRCPQTKKGLSPNNHLGNGCADLIIVSPCSRVQYINYLIRTGWTKKSPFDLRYVEAYRCRQFDFVAKPPNMKIDQPNNTDQPDNGYSSWNIDGELLTEASIRVKVNCQLLPVFGTGEPMKVRRRHPKCD